MLTHVVMIKMKDPDDRSEAVQRLMAMKGRIPSLNAIEAGQHDGVDPRGADVVLITRHDNRSGLQAYAVHPVHQELLAWLKPRLSSAQVVDFEEG